MSVTFESKLEPSMTVAEVVHAMITISSKTTLSLHFTLSLHRIQARTKHDDRASKLEPSTSSSNQARHSNPSSNQALVELESKLESKLESSTTMIELESKLESKLEPSTTFESKLVKLVFSLSLLVMTMMILHYNVVSNKCTNHLIIFCWVGVESHEIVELDINFPLFILHQLLELGMIVLPLSARNIRLFFRVPLIHQQIQSFIILLVFITPSSKSCHG